MKKLCTGILTATENHHFGNVFFDMSIESFSALGFQHGDSVNIYVSDGRSFTDVPYFSGYYERDGRPLLIAYPNDDRIELSIYCGLAWSWLGFSAGDTAFIELNEAGKYLDIQNALNLEYSVDRSDYGSDEEFSNFRPLRGGRMKENIIFRSASPCCNKFGRAHFADRVAERFGVKYLLDISDSGEDIARYMSRDSFSSPHFAALYENGKCSAMKMHAAFKTKDYGEKLARLLRAAINNEGPFLIYCVEGKDRTGFICALLEALCGADYEELCRDYMLTYRNYYGITEENEPERYRTILSTNFTEYLECLSGGAKHQDFPVCDYRQGAEAYLDSIGLTREEQLILEKKLTV